MARQVWNNLVSHNEGCLWPPSPLQGLESTYGPTLDPWLVKNCQWQGLGRLSLVGQVQNLVHHFLTGNWQPGQWLGAHSCKEMKVCIKGSPLNPFWNWVMVVFKFQDNIGLGDISCQLPWNPRNPKFQTLEKKAQGFYIFKIMLSWDCKMLGWVRIYRFEVKWTFWLQGVRPWTWVFVFISSYRQAWKMGTHWNLGFRSRWRCFESIDSEGKPKMTIHTYMVTWKCI